MRILYTCFNGINNSSKVLLDQINCSQKDKLYLKNSFQTSIKQLEERLSFYDIIISFGQAPLNKEKIKIELVGKKEDVYVTAYDYLSLKNKLEKVGFEVVLSKNAGNYLCNNLYYYGLRKIKERQLKTQMIFIHIPKLNDFKSLSKLSQFFSIY